MICVDVLSCDLQLYFFITVVFFFVFVVFFFFSSRRRHTRCSRDWSSDVCSSDLMIKSTTVTGSNWAIWDNTRSVVDPRNDALVANGTDAEFADNSSFSVDFLSDGFELNSN